MNNNSSEIQITFPRANKIPTSSAPVVILRSQERCTPGARARKVLGPPLIIQVTNSTGIQQHQLVEASERERAPQMRLCTNTPLNRPAPVSVVPMNEADIQKVFNGPVPEVVAPIISKPAVTTTPIKRGPRVAKPPQAAQSSTVPAAEPLVAPVFDIPEFLYPPEMGDEYTNYMLQSLDLDVAENMITLESMAPFDAFEEPFGLVDDEPEAVVEKPEEKEADVAESEEKEGSDAELEVPIIPLTTNDDFFSNMMETHNESPERPATSMSPQSQPITQFVLPANLEVSPFEPVFTAPLQKPTKEIVESVKPKTTAETLVLPLQQLLTPFRKEDSGQLDMPPVSESESEADFESSDEESEASETYDFSEELQDDSEEDENSSDDEDSDISADDNHAKIMEGIADLKELYVTPLPDDDIDDLEGCINFPEDVSPPSPPLLEEQPIIQHEPQVEVPATVTVEEPEPSFDDEEFELPFQFVTEEQIKQQILNVPKKRCRFDYLVVEVDPSPKKQRTKLYDRLEPFINVIDQNLMGPIREEFAAKLEKEDYTPAFKEKVLEQSSEVVLNQLCGFNSLSMMISIYFKSPRNTVYCPCCTKSISCLRCKYSIYKHGKCDGCIDSYSARLNFESKNTMQCAGINKDDPFDKERVVELCDNECSPKICKGCFCRFCVPCHRRLFINFLQKMHQVSTPQDIPHPLNIEISQEIYKVLGFDVFFEPVEKFVTSAHKHSLKVLEHYLH